MAVIIARVRVRVRLIAEAVPPPKKIGSLPSSLSFTTAWSPPRTSAKFRFDKATLPISS